MGIPPRKGRIAIVAAFIPSGEERCRRRASPPLTHRAAESRTVRRIATNTPLQAFVTLNDPVYVECAQALARRLLREGGATPEARVRWGVKLATAREATDTQVQALIGLLGASWRGAADPASAIKLAGGGSQTLPAGADPGELARLDRSRKCPAQHGRNFNQKMNAMNLRLAHARAMTRREFLAGTGRVSLSAMALDRCSARVQPPRSGPARPTSRSPAPPMRRRSSTSR